MRYPPQSTRVFLMSFLARFRIKAEPLISLWNAHAAFGVSLILVRSAPIFGLLHILTETLRSSWNYCCDERSWALSLSELTPRESSSSLILSNVWCQTFYSTTRGTSHLLCAAVSACGRIREESNSSPTWLRLTTLITDDVVWQAEQWCHSRKSGSARASV